MNPATGTFLNRDPVGGQMGRLASQNGYGYAEGNPAIYTDPGGKCPWCLVIGLGVLVGGLFYAVDPNGATAVADWALDHSGTYDLLDEFSHLEAEGEFLLTKKSSIWRTRGEWKATAKKALTSPYRNSPRYQQVRGDLEPYGYLEQFSDKLSY